MIFLKLECQKRNEENDRIKIVNLGPVNITEIKTFKNKRAVVECGINALKSNNISQLRGKLLKRDNRPKMESVVLRPTSTNENLTPNLIAISVSTRNRTFPVNLELPD